MIDQRKVIIKVATELMCKKGYHGTSLKMIADKVGLTKSTVLHYYNSKEEILLAVLGDALPAYIYRLRLLVNEEGIPSIQKLKKFIKLHMELVAERGDILRLHLSEAKYLSVKKFRRHKEERIHYTQLVKQLVEQVQKEDRRLFKGLNSTIVANSILGICNWAVRWYKKDGPINFDEVCDQIYRILDPR